MLLVSGCASVTYRGRHQYVYVQSEPSGATIVDDEEALGTTPSLIHLTRQRQRNIKLMRLDEVQTIDLETKYAWTESFFKNMFLFSLAPIGWVTDLISGAAWNFQDPAPAKFVQQRPLPAEPPRMIIAPPMSDNYQLSDEAGLYWEKQLPRLYPKLHVIPYRETLAGFQEAGYDYDERPSDVQGHRRVMFRLKAGQLFLSQIRNTQGTSELYGERLDLAGETQDFQASEKSIVKPGVQSSINEFMPNWFQFVPNTLGVDFSSSGASLSDGLVEYKSVESGSQSNLAHGISYLQALSVSHLQLPRADRQGRWKFQFVPAGSLSYKKIYFPTFAKLANVDFGFLQTVAGLGPEFGYQAGKHYGYLKFVFLLTYSQIEWRQPGGPEEKMSEPGSGIQFELGYLWFITERLSMRFFTKSGSAGVDLWNKVATKVNPTISPLTSAFTTNGGISFGYTFDTRDRVVVK